MLQLFRVTSRIENTHHYTNTIRRYIDKYYVLDLDINNIYLDFSYNGSLTRDSHVASNIMEPN